MTRLATILAMLLPAVGQVDGGVPCPASQHYQLWVCPAGGSDCRRSGGPVCGPTRCDLDLGRKATAEASGTALICAPAGIKIIRTRPSLERGTFNERHSPGT